LIQCSFPGNARQLRNVVEYLVCTSENGKCPKIAPALGEVFHGTEMVRDARKLVLEMIGSRTEQGLSSGRRSLAHALDLSEDRVKKILAELKADGLITV